MINLPGRKVIVKDDQVDRALRRLKKLVQASGVLDDLRRHEHYIKPTTERKLKSAAARKRWQKKLRDQQLPAQKY